MKQPELENKFTTLVQENQGIIHKACRLYCRNPEDCKDMFQEIILKLWKGYPSFRGDSKPTTWMYRVAINTAITWLYLENKSYEEIGNIIGITVSHVGVKIVRIKEKLEKIFN